MASSIRLDLGMGARYNVYKVGPEQILFVRSGVLCRQSERFDDVIDHYLFVVTSYTKQQEPRSLCKTWNFDYSLTLIPKSKPKDVEFYKWGIWRVPPKHSELLALCRDESSHPDIVPELKLHHECQFGEMDCDILEMLGIEPYVEIMGES